MSASAEIEPLSDFDWKTTKPLRSMPFKAIHNFSMGMSSICIITPTYVSL